MLLLTAFTSSLGDEAVVAEAERQAGCSSIRGVCLTEGAEVISCGCELPMNHLRWDISSQRIDYPILVWWQN